MEFDAQMHLQQLDAMMLDARIREIAKTDAIFKFGNTNLQATILKTYKKEK